MPYVLAADLTPTARQLAADCPAVRYDDLGTGALAGRLPVLRIGRGEFHLAVKGNAHADEPAGTVTCFALARWLADDPAGRALADRVTFHFLPSANPDGLARNEAWMVGETPAPLVWMQSVYRDPPAADREFGYGATPGEAAHPECAAWHRYLASLPRLEGYVSLHSMAFAGGAWFLVMLDDLARRQPLLDDLAAAAGAAGLPLHDEDRGGRKGFRRLAPGFCEAPTREGMAAFFEAAGTPEAAAWLKLNSMQVARQLHGTPVALVSELPQWWQPRLADLRPVSRRRAALDRAMGEALAHSLTELDEALAAAPPGPARDEAAARRAHRAAVGEALIALADDWGDRPSTARDEFAGDLLALRVAAENASLGWHLATDDVGRQRWHDRLACRVGVWWQHGEFRPLELSRQVSLQREMIVRLARHLTGVT